MICRCASPALIRVLVMSALLSALSRELPAQDTTPVVVDPTAGVSDGTDPIAASPEGSAEKTTKKFTPVVAPVPFKNSQFGWGLALMVGVIQRLDKDCTVKPSTGGVVGFYTQNDSWGVGIMEMARFAGDGWRVRVVALHGEFNYLYYGTGEEAGSEGKSIGIAQVSNFGNIAVLRRVAGGLYLGVSGLWIKADVTLKDTAGVGLPPIPNSELSSNLFAPGLQAEYDTRDNDFWPYDGSIGKLRANFFSTSLGSSLEFQRYMASWTSYVGLRGKGFVLAANASICSAVGDAPFWALCSLGAGKEGLRGYAAGRYRDSAMTTIQAELRYHTAGRWGAVVFAGAGQVLPTLGDVFTTDLLPAAGLGIRYQLVEKFPTHMRMDYAWGKNGGILYFAVGEAF